MYAYLAFLHLQQALELLRMLSISNWQPSIELKRKNRLIYSIIQMYKKRMSQFGGLLVHFVLVTSSEVELFEFIINFYQSFK